MISKAHMPVCLGSKISVDVYKRPGPLEAFTLAPSGMQQQPASRSGTPSKLPKLSLPLMSVGSPQSSMQKRIVFTRCDHHILATSPFSLHPYWKDYRSAMNATFCVGPLAIPVSRLQVSHHRHRTVQQTIQRQGKQKYLRGS